MLPRSHRYESESHRYKERLSIKITDKDKKNAYYFESLYCTPETNITLMLIILQNNNNNVYRQSFP